MVTFLEGEAGVFCVAALLGRLQKKEEVMYVTRHVQFTAHLTSPHAQRREPSEAKGGARHRYGHPVE